MPSGGKGSRAECQRRPYADDGGQRWRCRWRQRCSDAAGGGDGGGEYDHGAARRITTGVGISGAYSSKADHKASATTTAIGQTEAAALPSVRRSA